MRKKKKAMGIILTIITILIVLLMIVYTNHQVHLKK